MPTELITKLNWVDILVLVVIIRILYIGTKQGLGVEFAKVLGLSLGVVLSLHYYLGLSGFIASHSPLPSGFSELICYVVLITTVVLIFKFIRDGLALLIKVEPVPFVKIWGGLLLGAARAAIFCSVLLYTLMISGFHYVEKSTRQAYTFSYFIQVAPKIYSASFQGIIGKFFPSEKINQAISEVIEGKKEAKRQ